MILTYKVRHNADLERELTLARSVAEYAVEHKGPWLSSKAVKHLGLKADLSTGILTKYGKNRTIKKVVRQPKLTISSYNRRYRLTDKGLYIPSLKLTLDVSHIPQTTKYNMIELDREWAYISITVPETTEYKPKTAIGIDRNTNGHCVVAACPTDGTVFKLGKSAKHVRVKYSSLLRTMQKKRRTVKIREARIMRDMNHKIANKLVDEAIKRKAVLVLENLKGIRRKTRSKKFGRLLNSWSYFQLQEFMEYKAKLHGVPVAYIDPRYTSQQCGKCGLIGKRQDKVFHCLECGNVEHADVNAAFVIALRQMGVLDCPKKEIVARAVSATPKGIGL
jgi:putative transposase